MIIYKFPEEITLGNVTTVINSQNPEFTLNVEDITDKYMYKTRNGKYNMLIELGPPNRKQILQTKLKIGWEIYKVEDNLIHKSISRCSQFNRKQSDCKEEEIYLH